MPSDKEWKDVDMRCPFYACVYRKNRTLRCEGIIKGTTTKHTFRGQKAFERHLSQFCADDYEACPHYKAMTEIKYRN